LQWLQSLLFAALASAAVVLVLIAGSTLVNYWAMGGARIALGIDALVDRAEALAAVARPDYQRVALAALPPNPGVGPVFRLDDRERPVSGLRCGDYQCFSGLDRLQSTNEEAWRRFNGGQGQDYQFDPEVLERLEALGYVE
jgi:hypothetical protein